MKNKGFFDEEDEDEEEGENDEESGDECYVKGKGLKKKDSEYWKEVVGEFLKESKINKDREKIRGDESLIFEEFVRKRFYNIREWLAFFMKNL